MREITGQLTPELKEFYNKNVGKSKPFYVKTYYELAKLIAKLSYLNKNHLLFFRGHKVQIIEAKMDYQLFIQLSICNLPLK